MYTSSLVVEESLDLPDCAFLLVKRAEQGGGIRTCNMGSAAVTNGCPWL